MSTIKTAVDRRSFLKVSAAAGGGMLLGFGWLSSCAREPETGLEIPESWTDINAFLKIGDNGVVTIMSPNPEIGQNVKTSMPMIVAEELDVDWQKVVVEQAGLDTEKFTRQVAGGSQSIRQSWKSLRTAGATARRMLMEAAAKEWDVPVTELTTEEGTIHHKSSGKSIGYGAVATAAAALEVPEEVELKNPKDFKIIGTSRKNVDALEIVTGKPLYGLDVQKEGMRIAMIAHPPAFGQKLKSFNAEEVLNMPGVEQVFAINAAPEGVELQWSDTNAFPELIAIVGRSTWEVMQAKKALKAEWETVESPESSADHEAALSELMDKAADEPARRDGDPGKAFQGAAKVVERTYAAPFLAHNTLEPMNFYANVTGDKAELEGPIQTPESLRKTVSALLGMEEAQVSIMLTRMGGGFGRRLYGNFGSEAALISQKAGVPVKLVYTREDDMTQGTYRPAYKVKYRAALDADNNLLAFHVRGAGVHGSPVFENRFPAGAVDHYLAEHHDLGSNISTGAWRAPRSNFMAYAEQAFIDEIAEVTGQDPIDFRLQLFEKAQQSPVGENNDYDAARYAGVLKLVKEKAGWGKPTPGLHRGVSAYYCHNSYVAQVVDVEMQGSTPRIKKVWCAVDCGIVVNPDAARNQIEGGIVDGIGHAMYSAITFKNGTPEQQNFDRYRLIRNSEAPMEIETFFVDNGIDPTGLGEPSLPPIQSALANALYRATGERIYRQPFVSENEVLG